MKTALYNLALATDQTPGSALGKNSYRIDAPPLSSITASTRSAPASSITVPLIPVKYPQTRHSACVMLPAGLNPIATMSGPDRLNYIPGRHSVLIIERAGADVDQAVDTGGRHLVQNDVSSTKVRLFLRRGLGVRYLLPSPVVDYIEQHGLYMDDGVTPSAAAGAIQAEREKGKEKELGVSSSAAGGVLAVVGH